MPVETPVCSVKTLEYLLRGLRMKKRALDGSREVRLHALEADVLAVYAVVSALERKGVIPHKTSLPEHRVMMPSAPVAV